MVETCPSTAGGMGLIPGQGNSACHVVQIKVKMKLDPSGILIPVIEIKYL